jgi:hypothetical protein
VRLYPVVESVDQLTQYVPTLKVTLINYSKRGDWGPFELKKTLDFLDFSQVVIQFIDVGFVAKIM